MLNGTLVICHDMTPNAKTARAVVEVLKTLPEQALPLVLCGFDREACLALSALISDVCYNTYDYLTCAPEVFTQTDTLPYVMLVGGGEARHFSVQNSAEKSLQHATLKTTQMKEALHVAPARSARRKCQLAVGRRHFKTPATPAGRSPRKPFC